MNGKAPIMSAKAPTMSAKAPSISAKTPTMSAKVPTASAKAKTTSVRCEALAFPNIFFSDFCRVLHIFLCFAIQLAPSPRGSILPSIQNFLQGIGHSGTQAVTY